MEILIAKKHNRNKEAPQIDGDREKKVTIQYLGRLDERSS